MHYSHGGAFAYQYLFPCEASIFQHYRFPLDHSSRATRPNGPEYLQQHTYDLLQYTSQKPTFLRERPYNIHFLGIALLLGRLRGEVIFFIHKVQDIMGGYLFELLILLS